MSDEVEDFELWARARFPYFSWTDDYDEGWGSVRPDMRGGIARYIMYGICPGNFLTGVLEKDMEKAFNSADRGNRQIVGAYYRFFVNFIPSIAWGDHETVEAWIRSGGIEGQKKNEQSA